MLRPRSLVGSTVVLAVLAAAAALWLASQRGAPVDERAAALMDLQRAQTPEEAGAAEQALWRRFAAAGGSTMSELLARADAKADAGEAEAADALYGHVVTLAPGFAEGWRRRALFRYRQGDLPGAYEDLSQALAREPRHFAAWADAGVVLEDWGRPALALHAYREALAIHPYLAEAQRGARRVEAQSDGVWL